MPPTIRDRQQLTDVQAGFIGGLNTTGDVFSLGPTQMTQAVNARLTQFGSAVKRLGTQRTHAAALAGEVQGGFCWRKAASTEHLTVAGGTFYSGGASFVIPMTWTSQALAAGTAVSASARVSFVAFRDGAGEVVYAADGGALLKWDGATWTRITTVGTPTSISRLAVYNQRLFGISGADQTIYYSALNNGDTLGITGSLGGSAVIRTFGDQKLTTLAALRDALAIFHVSGISRFVGLTQDDISIAAGVQGFSSDVGTLMPNSVIVIDGRGFFTSDRGTYMIADDGIQALDTPEKPDPTVSVLSALPATDLDAVSVVHDRKNREVRWNFPGVGLYALNYRLMSWTGPWTGTYLSAETSTQWDAQDSVGNSVVLFGAVDGFVRQADVGGQYLDDVLSDGTGGERFSIVIGCRRFFTRHPANDKALRWAYLYADIGASQTTTVTWATVDSSYTYTVANANPPSIWGSSTWGSFVWGSGGGRTFRIPLGGRGTFADFTISDDGSASSVYSRVELVAYDLGPRG